MDVKAIIIVENYILEHLDKSDPEPEFEVYIVWKCKALQNWKYLLSSSLYDGMYYELTYNGDKQEWYLDAYKKFENRVIKERDEGLSSVFENITSENDAYGTHVGHVIKERDESVFATVTPENAAYGTYVGHF